MNEFVEISNISISSVHDARSVIERHNIIGSNAITTLRFVIKIDEFPNNYVNVIYNSFKFNTYKETNANTFLNYINLIFEYRDDIIWFTDEFHKYHNFVPITQIKYLRAKRILENIRKIRNSNIEPNYNLNNEILQFIDKSTYTHYRTYNGIKICYYSKVCHYVNLPFMHLQGNTKIPEALHKYLTLGKRLESRLNRLKIGNLKKL